MNNTLKNQTVTKQERFLAAWKKGVNLIGKEYFKKIDDVAAATHKDELTPNYELIQHSIFTLSTGQAIFLAAMYCFYNREEGQDLLEQLGYPNFLDIFCRLDQEYIDILDELINYYHGWC